MASALPYLPSNKNISTIFNKIASARIPDAFTHSFLQQTIGLKGSNDRALIPLLRTLGFLDASVRPTPAYRLLKNASTAKVAVATAIRKAYAPLFAADENAHALPTDKLKGLVSQVAGTDDDMTARIVSTFNGLVKAADFSGTLTETEEKGEDVITTESAGVVRENFKGLRPEFHYNIQIHLPANGSEEIYLNIFNALRKVFQ